MRAWTSTIVGFCGVLAPARFVFTAAESVDSISTAAIRTTSRGNNGRPRRPRPVFVR